MSRIRHGFRSCLKCAAANVDLLPTGLCAKCASGKQDMSIAEPLPRADIRPRTITGMFAPARHPYQHHARRPLPQLPHTSKVSETQVIEIRRRHATGKVTHAQLSAEYGISTTQVGRIVHGDNWRHLLTESEAQS